MTQPPITPPPGQNGGQDPRRQQPGSAGQSGRPGQAQAPGQIQWGVPSGAAQRGQYPQQGQYPAPGQTQGAPQAWGNGQFSAPGQAPQQGQPPRPPGQVPPGQFPQPTQHPGHQRQQPGQFPQQQVPGPGQVPFGQVPPSNLPAGAPPPRFAPQQQAPAQPKRRELGEDPELQKQRKRPVGLLVGIGVSGLAILALVVGLFMAFNSPNDPTIPVGGADPQGVTSTPIPTSTLMPASPQDAAPGYIPITTDVVFPNGLTVVNPSLGGWEQDVSERQPNLYILSDPQSGAYFSVAQENLHKNEYRDEDMTRSELNSASLQFTAKPEPVGDPVPLVLKGQGGYELELLAQRLRWSDGSEGMMATRYMPSTGTKITILANAWGGELDDPTSRISQKVAEITFTTP